MDAVACKSAASALTEATVSRRFAAFTEAQSSESVDVRAAPSLLLLSGIHTDITDLTDPGIRAGDHALSRSITDTRKALGLDLLTAGHDHGRDID